MVRDMGSQQTILGRLEGHDAPIRHVAARGNVAVSAQRSGPLRLWNLTTLQCTATLPDMPDTRASYCMEGKVLLGSADGPIKVWDIAASSPVPLPDLEGHAAVVWCVKASASLALSCSADETAWLWDLRTSRCVRTMEGHTGAVWSADMDGHCRTAVSGSTDKTVKLWDLGSGRCIETYQGHASYVRDVVMHESGSSFLSAGNEDCIVNAWVVGRTEPIMMADFTALCPPDSRSHLFTSRDLSKVACCCISDDELELRYW